MNRIWGRRLPSAMLFVTLLVSTLPVSLPAFAQLRDVRKPVDMMIVIDNSCSMFPEDQLVPGCEVWGNDPDFLRIVGADLFAARLGFAEVNEAEYQAGVISLGKSPRLIMPLQPLSAARDAVAEAIANPSAELATGIVPALEMAYKELRESPARKATNLPAIVLITDGIPYPRQGQSNSEIEQLVAENPDIPLFIMLLQNPDRPSAEYNEYIRFWEQLQARHTHVFTYRIKDAKQIEETYNSIIAQLQNTIPSEGIGVAPGSPLQVFVSRYVQRMVVTIIHKASGEKGVVTIADPRGQAVLDNEPGVDHFRGLKNPVEVVSIFAPRLQEDLKEDYWTITSDAPVIVFLDRQGAYRLNFVEPAVSLTDISNIYLATDRHSPHKEFVIRFNLLDKDQSPVLDPQPIQGKVIHPDGQEANLRIPADLQPDAAGVYEIRFDFASAYPTILDKSGRFDFNIDAGSADDHASKRIPIANAKLLVDVGRGCYIQDAVPQPLLCTAGQPAELSVILGDYDTCRADTLQVRVLGAGAESELTPDVTGTFRGDVTDLCTALLAGMPCSTQQDSTFQIRMAAQLIDGSLPSQSEQQIPVQAVAPTCTPTPSPTPTLTPTPTATPTPTPTPCPDRDGDGFDDCGQDQCPNEPGIAQLQGCPVTWWMWLIAGLLVLALSAFVWFWLRPRIQVRLSPLPDCYVVVEKERERGTGISVRDRGLEKHKSRVTIGGDRKKALIVVEGLKPIEFVVEKQGEEVVLLDGEKGVPKARFRKEERMVTTSDTDIKLYIGLGKEDAKQEKPERQGPKPKQPIPERRPDPRK